VTTRLDAARDRVANLAEWSRQHWQVETSLAPLTTTRPMDGLHGQTGPGVLKALTILAIVDTLGRMVMAYQSDANTSAWSGSAFSRRCDGSARRAAGCR
jgi:hypothetical protein